jgi:tetrahydromethanopterin S-methyltransferase subunit G
MKALKTFISIILGFVMFILLGLFTVITSVRIILSGDSFGKIMQDLTNQNQDISIGNSFDTNSLTSEELDRALDEIDNYVSRDEIYEALGNVSSQFIKYYIGAIDDIDTDEVKDLTEKIAKKYEEKTGERIDLSEINENIDKAKEEMKQEVKNTNSEELEKIQYLRYFFDNGIYFGIIIGFIICGLLIVLINKSIIPLFVHLLIITILNGIGFGIIFIATKFIPISDEAANVIIMNSINGLFTKILIGYIVAAVLLIIGLVIAKKTKKPEKVNV